MTEIVKIQQQFGDYLFNFIKSRVSSTEDAQDIYQELILKIIQKSDQLKKTTSLKSWLFTIARNQIIDYYRSRKLHLDIDSVTSEYSTVEDAGAYQELEGCLSCLIDALPDDYKNIIKLSEIEGKSQKELAENLGVNYVTLRSKVQRGRLKLKQMIFDACSVEQDAGGTVVECKPQVAANSRCESGKSCL